MQHLTRADQGIESFGTPLSAPGIVALRNALRDYVSGRPVDRGLFQASQLLCDHARRRGQRVEQLVIALKAIWWSLPETQRVSRDATGARLLLSRVVSMCIDQFYASERAN